MNLLELLFPTFCVSCKKLGAYLCTDCFSKLSFDVLEVCLLCKKPAIGGLTHPVCRTPYVIDGTFTAISYKHVAKKLLYTFKYKPYVSHVSSVLVDLLYEAIIQKEVFIRLYQKQKTNIFFVPIPLFKAKLKKRGYNQAEILAKELGKKLEVPLVPLLERVKETTPQMGLTEMQRKENIKGAFGVIKGKEKLLQDRVVFVIDDVLTTGATFSEAAKVLKRSGAKQVWGLALARD